MERPVFSLHCIYIYAIEEMLLSKATSYIDGGVCHAWSRPTHQELFDVQYLAQRDMLTKGIEPSDNNTLALSYSHPLPLVCDSTSLLFFV